jgi:hypothetical protein
MFVTFNIRRSTYFVFLTELVCMFVIYFHTKCYVPICNSSLVMLDGKLNTDFMSPLCLYFALYKMIIYVLLLFIHVIFTFR